MLLSVQLGGRVITGMTGTEFKYLFGRTELTQVWDVVCFCTICSYSHCDTGWTSEKWFLHSRQGQEFYLVSKVTGM